jgi:hypothetical protein
MVLVVMVTRGRVPVVVVFADDCRQRWLVR